MACVNGRQICCAWFNTTSAVLQPPCGEVPATLSPRCQSSVHVHRCPAKSLSFFCSLNILHMRLRPWGLTHRAVDVEVLPLPAATKAWHL
eukprot:CAMPEP_0172874268 /NCGR_PEP_ID=MMETSP1075-20121228/97638_1 /TAXON_ID=2916 /ORGANISM="Ceratium fusus, Strain PA161109" /LENGTH=89 /DNA_ID=CAMNT_0013725009 /DNA_START=180 /DNA_END=445 /DNA_ORIENTATION=-